jgi:hypothetical protein
MSVSRDLMEVGPALGLLVVSYFRFASRHREPPWPPSKRALRSVGRIMGVTAAVFVAVLCLVFAVAWTVHVLRSQ